MSSLHASSFSTTPPKCLCGEMTRLKLSNTSRNPRRPFYSYSNYNKEGRSYCEYFLWADIEVENEAKIACEREHTLKRKKNNSENGRKNSKKGKKNSRVIGMSFML
ncbi:hypothetical protein CIPAW_16G028500 [Carya illinoinensis]|uniref:GRF-type domain-containing protein n=1 Tax=Carya illinoinensis TaxID=32201 RepID=A0A8T1N1N6_CARIL|nr:hypothetical protein CIPAW_16G028500 [Carya illinoinensis]